LEKHGDQDTRTASHSRSSTKNTVPILGYNSEAYNLPGGSITSQNGTTLHFSVHIEKVSGKNRNSEAQKLLGIPSQIGTAAHSKTKMKMTKLPLGGIREQDMNKRKIWRKTMV